MKVYAVEEVEMTPGRIMYEVCVYDLGRKTKTIHAICRTRDP